MQYPDYHPERGTYIVNTSGASGTSLTSRSSGTSYTSRASSASYTSGSSYADSGLTPVGAEAPRRMGEATFLGEDWGTEGSIESGQSGMGSTSGPHGGEASPVGGALLPMLLMVAGYALYKKFRTIFARRT